eukprot:122171-Pelagomonas_calceolata.AAC.3
MVNSFFSGNSRELACAATQGVMHAKLYAACKITIQVPTKGDECALPEGHRKMLPGTHQPEPFR